MDYPLIWIDANLRTIVGATEKKVKLGLTTRNKTLFIQPNEENGLTAGYLALIDRFIADPTRIPNNYENGDYADDSFY